jgi:hypothetical protein
MALQGLGYIGFGSAALDDWRQFGTSLVGLQAVERSPSLLAFRMDDRKQRIIVDRSLKEDERFFGWEVEDAAALDELAACLDPYKARGPSRQRMHDHRTRDRGCRTGKKRFEILLGPGDRAPVGLFRACKIVEDADRGDGIVGGVNHVIGHKTFDIADDRDRALLDATRQFF